MPNNVLRVNVGKFINIDKVYIITKKKCDNENKIIESDGEKIDYKEMLMILLKENKEIRKQMGELIPKVGNNNSMNSNNSVKQKFNINVFLNEDCKDALTMNEFIDKIKVTLDDLMITKDKIPFINENFNVEKAIEIINLKKLGAVITRDKKNNTTGILTDGDIKRLLSKFNNIKMIPIKDIIKKAPISVERDLLAAKALKIMNDKKITSLCVHSKSKKNKTVGLIHIHNILDANIQ